LSEAIAIVYSPITREKYKVFRVKDSRVREIQGCSKSGFHEHKDQYGQPAFEECSHAHIFRGKDNGTVTRTIDLR